MNARGGRSARLIAGMARIPGVAALSRHVPRKLLMSVRGLLESDRGRGEQSAAERPTYSVEERRFVEAALARDREFVNELFADGPLLTGTRVHASSS